MKKKNTYKTSQVRIISGKWKGHKIFIPNNSKLRLTSNKTRETIFNWLTPVIRDANCLDCFAGSGALGFEALSRYAFNVTLLEKNYLISMQLKKTMNNLKTSRAQIINTNSMKWLNKFGNIYNIVFIDPPFRQGMVNKTIDLLECYNHLAIESWIYIETEFENSSLRIPKNWVLYRKKKAGQVIYQLYIRHKYSLSKTNLSNTQI